MILRRSISGERLTAALGFTCGVAIAPARMALSAPPSKRRAPKRRCATSCIRRRRSSSRGRPLELRYDVVCQADSFGTPCTPDGQSVCSAGRTSSSIGRVALAPAGGTALAATVDVAAGSVSYYAVIDDGAGSSMTVPAAGLSAPQRAWAVPELAAVSLGTHAFGHVRKPDGGAVTATWGTAADPRPAHGARARPHRPIGVRRRRPRERRRARSGQRPARPVSGRRGMGPSYTQHRLRGWGGRPHCWRRRYGLRPRPGCRARRRSYGPPAARRDDGRPRRGRGHAAQRAGGNVPPRLSGRHVDADRGRRRRTPRARSAGRRRTTGAPRAEGASRS